MTARQATQKFGLPTAALLIGVVGGAVGLWLSTKAEGKEEGRNEQRITALELQVPAIKSEALEAVRSVEGRLGSQLNVIQTDIRRLGDKIDSALWGRYPKGANP